MDMILKQHFLDRWSTYFPTVDLPITFQYSAKPLEETLPPAKGWTCLMAQLKAVFAGSDRCFAKDSIGCAGGKTYAGFGHQLNPDFNEFLSWGIPGKLEGERYKKSPDTVKALMANSPGFDAPQPYLIARRFDHLGPEDQPQVAVFLATPDVLSGLFTLAGFEDDQPYVTIAPFSAGCGSIVKFPMLELSSGLNRPVLGMFDVSARPFVPEHTLSFAVTMPLLEKMAANMDESFLITGSWQRVAGRIAKT